MIKDILVLTNCNNCLWGVSWQKWKRHNLRFKKLAMLLKSMITTPIVVVPLEYLDIFTKVSMLNSGADQFFSLPVTTEDVSASISAQIRRYAEWSKPINLAPIIYSHNILINCDHYKVDMFLIV